MPLSIRLWIGVLFFIIIGNKNTLQAQQPDLLTWNHRPVLKEAALLTKQLYIFPEVGRQLQQELLAHAEQKTFQYLSPQELADTLTTILRTVSGDKHFTLLYTPHLPYYSSNPYASKRLRPLPLYAPLSDSTTLKKLTFNTQAIGFQEVGVLPHNIGYINYTYFASKAASEYTLAVVMTALSSTDALIIDLRNNRGGYVETMLLFASYFIKKKQRLSTTYYRHEGRRVPNRTQLHVKGEKYLYRPVYFLISPQTRSAGEAFCYHLQQYNAALAIGETTAGMANPVELHILAREFCFFVPVGQETSAITGTNWEKTGISPDLACPAKHALATAQIEALKSFLLVHQQTPTEQQSIEQHIQQLEQSILSE